MTVLILSLKQPVNATLRAIWALHKEYLTYAVSFFVLAITWHNLHNTLQVVNKLMGVCYGQIHYCYLQFHFSHM